MIKTKKQNIQYKRLELFYVLAKRLIVMFPLCMVDIINNKL
jgi:hypothetical protein